MELSETVNAHTLSTPTPSTPHDDLARTDHADLSRGTGGVENKRNPLERDGLRHVPGPLEFSPQHGRSYSVSEYLALPREAETWLVRPLIPVSGRVNLYGDSKVGKSYAAIQLCAAIAGNIPDWLGFSIPTHGPVLYVQLDTPRSLWIARIEEVQNAGFPLDNIHFADRESLDAWPFDISRPDHYYRLREEVSRVQPVAVVIDTLREAHAADENSATDMQPVTARLTSAVRPAALILVSHSRKANPEFGPDLINDQRGSNYIPGAMDAIIRFTKKHVIYTGRACEEGSIKLRRLDCGLWEPERDPALDQHIAAVLADASVTSLAARARLLAGLSGKTEDACRGLLRRVAETSRPPGQAQPSSG